VPQPQRSMGRSIIKLDEYQARYEAKIKEVKGHLKNARRIKESFCDEIEQEIKASTN
jgi:hypothetical protein